MDFHTDPSAVGNCRHVRSDYGIHSGSLGGIQCGTHSGKVFFVQGDVQGHVGPDTIFPADPDDFREVFD